MRGRGDDGMIWGSLGMDGRSNRQRVFVFAIVMRMVMIVQSIIVMMVQAAIVMMVQAAIK